jgi:hypothetical protein
MINATIDFPKEDITALQQMMFRYSEHFNGNAKKTVEATMVKIITALRAANSTKKSKPTRKIIDWHIPRQLAHGDRKYIPESRYAIEVFTQKGKRMVPIRSAKSKSQATQIASRFMANQYNIKKSGLARSSWSWILKQMGKSGAIEQRQITGTTEVKKVEQVSGGVLQFGINATNRLSYIRKAMKANITTALARASTMMRKQMERNKRDAAQAIGRAA